MPASTPRPGPALDAPGGAFTEVALAALFDAMPQGAACLRLQGEGLAGNDFHILYTNPAFHRLTGRQPAPGSLWSERPDGRDGPEPGLQCKLAQLVRDNGSCMFGHFDAELDKWFQLTAYCPSPGHLMLVFSDNSAAHRAEAVLQHSEQRLRAIIEASPVPFGLVDGAGKLTYLNAAFVQTYGYTLAQIAQLEDWWCAAHPEPQYRAWVRSTWDARLAQSLREGKPFERFEVTVHCREGRQRNVVISMAPLGQALEGGYLVVLYDISFHRSARQAVADAQAYAEQILESMGEGLCQVDEDGVLTFMSPAGAKLLGYSPLEVIGKRAHALFHHSDPHGRPYPAADGAVHLALRQGAPHAVDSEVFWRKDGSCFAVHYVSSPMVVGGVHRGAVVTFRDISEETRIRRALLDKETKLQEMNETLESRVQERTRELLAALNSAELAKRSRGQFLANMSHEIRTPMNSVMGMVYLALKAEPSPAQRAYLEKIQKSGAHLLGIINDILDFSKIDAGKLQLDSGIFDLQQVMQHIVQLAGGKAAEKGLSLRLDIGPDVPTLLHGDALRLGQILVNFLNNATKFTERGGVVIRVQLIPAPAEARPADSCMLCFEVEDTGIGIEESQRARLFESFEQGDQSTTRNFGGTGLGLAISRQLALLMGGEVGLSSQLGVGSTFWFVARFQRAQEARQQARQPTNVRDAMAVLSGKKVLVVDDNAFNLEVARGLLEDLGLLVFTAENGEQALTAVNNTRFDCVLMDMQMPVMDGVTAARQIRNQPATADLVVIAMTANAGQDDQNLCLHAGMNEVVTKPIDPDRLFLVLARWLRAPQQSRQAAATAPAPSFFRPVLPDAAELPVWDEAALARIVGNNPAAHARLLNKFRHTAHEAVLAIQSGAAAGQWAAVADQAHKLKSSARSVGAMQLGALCDTLEHEGRGKDAVACMALVQAVGQSYVQVQAHIGEPQVATQISPG